MIGARATTPVRGVYGRRAVLGAVVGSAGWALTPWRALAQSVPPAGQLAFDILRRGSRIGQETLTFRQAGNRLIVDVEVSIRVTMAMIPIYRLHHHETETWQAGQLLSFAATTEKNGSQYYAQGWRDGEAFMARGTACPKAYVAPAHALPTSQWNHRMLNGPMINTEDAKLMRPVVTDLGFAEVPLADGGTVRARHYRARGDLRFDTFFSENWEWVGLSFHAPDGSLVTYRKA
ncbi:MAG: hypothetical protein HIU92_11055 [Proteobacteria bacterium]|nr:hypothetical protein [Pseudomonadota bacterium]